MDVAMLWNLLLRIFFDSCSNIFRFRFGCFFYSRRSFASIILSIHHILDAIIMVMSQSHAVLNEFLSITFWIFNYYFWNQNGTVSYDWQPIRNNEKGKLCHFWHLKMCRELKHFTWDQNQSNHLKWRRIYSGMAISYFVFRSLPMKCAVSFFV